MRKHLSTIILILIFLAGLSLLLYPTVSDYWNSFHQSRAIASYEQAVAGIGTDGYDNLRAQAEAYNRTLEGKENRFVLSEEETEAYNSLLDVTGTGIMGYIEIPGLDCRLPIYHSVDEEVLQIAVGHLPGSSLPVGGESTHTILSGHRGLPSARLFTDLDQMKEGDIFLLRVLDQTLAYEVDQIKIVLPEQTEDLEIVPGMDYCTLVTCTPYGINTHRLLVRGHRVDYTEAKIHLVEPDATRVDPVLVAGVIAVPLLLILLVLLFVPRKGGKRGRKERTL